MNVASLAAAHGLIVDHPIGDGRWKRVRTEDKPRKKNGSYLWDSLRGILVLRNWASMDDCAVYHDESVKVDEAAMRRMRERMRQSQEQDIRRRNRAADTAQDMVQRATFVTPAPAVAGKAWRIGKPAVLAHPYLIRKGFPEAAGLVLDGELLVPMWIGKRLVSLQRIAEDGSKKFLFGGTSKGAFYRIGNPKAREQWLCEGYATALSIKRALEQLHADAAVVVCFSAGNLKECPGTHVFADGDEAGRKGAEATGKPWVSAPDGMDANDLMVMDGVGAVVQLIRSLRAGA